MCQTTKPAQMRTFRTFADFWPFYLREHARPRTRALPYAGTSLVVLIGAAALLTGDIRLLPAMPVAGYAFAWAGPGLVERNRPATFTHPLWSLAADFRMWWLWLTGRIGDALRSAGMEPQEEDKRLGG